MTAFKRHLAPALLVLTLGCLGGAGWLIYSNQRAEMASGRGERHAREVIQQWGDLLSSLKDAETGQRGFIITGKPDYLEPYQASLAGIAAGLADLRRLTADDPQQQQRLDAITPLVAAKLAELKETIALRETQGFPAASAAVMTQAGKKIMDEMRALVAQTQAQEAQLLEERIVTHATDYRRTMQSVALGGAISGIALLLLFIRLRWELVSRQRADAVSRGNEHRLRVATDAAELGIWTWQPDGDRISWENDKPYEIFRMPLTDAPLTAARFAAEFVHAEDLAAFEQAIGNTVQNGARLFYQGRFHCPDGELRWVEFTGQPVAGTSGPSLRVTGTAQDITERKQAEQLLRQNRDTFFDLIQNAPFGLYVVDAQFRLRQISTASQKVFSTIDPLIGRDFEEVLRLVWAEPFVSEALEHFRHTLATGESYAAPNTTEQRQNIPDIESYDWKIERITLPDGQFGVVCYFYDITERIQAQAALRESEERLRLALAVGGMGVWLVDLAPGGVATFDEQACRLMGLEPACRELAMSEIVEKVIHPDDRELIETAMSGIVEGVQAGVVEYRMIRPDGKVIWLQGDGITQQGAAGTPVRFIGVNFDITERRQAEHALRESEAFSRSIIKSSPDCIKVLDLEGNLLSMESGQEMLGIEDIRPFLNKSWLDFWQDADDKQAAQAAVAAAAAGGAGAFVGSFRTLRGELKWWDVAISPILDADGQPARLLAASRDVTGRQQAEDGLRQSEERFRALFDRGPIAIFACDAAGIAQEFNPCAVQLWGREPKRGDSDERFSGSHRLYLPDGTFVPRAHTPMAAVLRGDNAGVYDEEFIVERPDGSRISINSNTVPLKNAQGQITGGMCCFYDITERKRLERESFEQVQTLADLDRRKDEFLAMLSHELRNPLAAMSNAVQLLRLQKEDGPIQGQARSIIERQVGQLQSLVDDLLEVSRINTGRVRLRREPVSARGIMERAVETAQPLMTQRGHQLDVLLPAQAVFVHADAARLEQVLVNLLTNAAKYTDEGGHIWLSAEAADAAEAAANGKAAVPMVVIKVRDTGMGIAPELLPHIFDLFTQADRSLDRSQGGLGIGLCLVQRLVELHGGTVEAHSVLGQGSEFVVRLPVVQPTLPTVSSPVPGTAPAPLKASRGCRVLVVDDNVDAAQGMAMLLEMTGHEFRLAYDGPSALEAVMDYQPDVVLLDIGLPGLDGFEVAKRIRQQAPRRGMVLVALTGYGQDTDRQRSKDAGLDYHLVKPVNFSQIEEILLSVSEG